MNDQEKFEQFIELCKRVYERMASENSWPWEDSPNSEDLVDFED